MVDPQSVLPLAHNPFVYARALAPDEAMSRPEGVGLLDRAAGGHNVVLYAPRRFGKTTLLNQVLEQATERDMPGVRIDLSDVLSPADVAARLEQAFRAMPGALRRLVSKELGSVSIMTPAGGSA
jgi:ATP/maltotriose-dependent transcriptional regulator MalT